MKKVGFFGGSFDPIHFGHLQLAVELLESGLDEILFCPAYCSPFKIKEPPIEGRHRLEMIRRAIFEIPNCRVTAIELERKEPSFTVDTLRMLNHDVQYRLILTEESAKHLDKWKEPEEIVRMAPPIIGKRIFPISSTEIRARLKKKLYCGHLVPKVALDYIEEHELY